MTRALRSVAVVLLLLAPMALSACSAGQVTQTATQARDKTGGASQVGDIRIRAVQLVHPPGGVYQKGDGAEVTMAIVNGGRVDDRLVDVVGADFTSATVSASPPTGDASSITGPSGSSVAPSGEPAASEAVAGDVLIPAGETVFVGAGDTRVVLTGLTRRLDAAQSVTVTLTFARAGETTVSAIGAPPPGVLPRDPGFDFHAGTGGPVDRRSEQ